MPGQNHVESIKIPEATRKDGEKHLTDVGDHKNKLQPPFTTNHGKSSVSLFDRILPFIVPLVNVNVRINRITTRIRARPCLRRNQLDKHLCMYIPGEHGFTGRYRFVFSPGRERFILFVSSKTGRPTCLSRRKSSNCYSCCLCINNSNPYRTLYGFETTRIRRLRAMCFR